MAKYLTNDELDALSNAIMDTVGYSTSIRKIFISDINTKFRLQLDQDANDQVQLDLDLIKLNKTERLVDGTIPFQSWLQSAARYLQPYPAEISIVQNAQAAVEGKAVKSQQPATVASPPAEAIKKMELIVHQNDMVSFSFFEAGAKAGLGVVRILVPRFENGVKIMVNGNASLFAGTAWMLTKELIITNHHVINARNENEPDASQADFTKQGEDAIAEFDYNIDETPGNAVKIAKLEAADAQLDYAILRLANPVTDRLPPARFPSEVFIVSSNPQPVNIIQHPFGHSKKIAIRNNHIFESSFPLIGYFTDTEKGSSGSPVFNDKWQVVGMHRAARLVKDVVYQGKSTGWVNEGVQLKAIFDHLDTNFKPLRTEILNN
jgi:endonuclease G, mitochondrial